MENYQKFIKRKSEQFKNSKPIELKDVGRKGKFIFKKEAWTFVPQYNLKNKVFLIERLRLKTKKGKTSHPRIKRGDIEYRIGYYIVGKIGQAKTKWTWGQYCPIIPGRDLKKLLAKAKKDKTLLD